MACTLRQALLTAIALLAWSCQSTPTAVGTWALAPETFDEWELYRGMPRAFQEMLMPVEEDQLELTLTADGHMHLWRRERGHESTQSATYTIVTTKEDTIVIRFGGEEWNTVDGEVPWPGTTEQPVHNRITIRGNLMLLEAEPILPLKRK